MPCVPKQMIYYTPSVGGKRAAVLRELGIRCLLTAAGLRASFSEQYALDNGAWPAHLRGRALDLDAFDAALHAVGSAADFVVLPDVVGDWRSTLSLSSEWVDAVAAVTPRHLLAVQDGATPADLPSWCRGVFVGGTTGWKEATMTQWCSLGLYCHVGRVNTRRRLAMAYRSWADSVDGSGPAMFDSCARKIEMWMRELRCELRFDFREPTAEELCCVADAK